MCGIAGTIGRADLAIVSRMLDAERHRGPDDRGTWASADANVALGHVRLSIIDCSAGGHQPMATEDGRLVTVFNGEIYNYRELRAELEAKGRTFRSSSDTEVLLAAYAEWGPRCLERLVGMFAFALLDRRPPPGAPGAVLARDRLGIKPLLYAEVDEVLAFASELRGLLASGMVKRRLDADAVLDFAAFGAVSQPRTLLAGVQALPPGTRLEVRGRDREVVRWWGLHESTERLRSDLAGISADEAAARVRAALDEATRYHLVADVPVGAFLSGGVDSTAVVGLMRRASGAPVRTFSVGFEDRHGRMDERRYAHLAAAHLGCQHSDVVVDAAQAAEAFPAFCDAVDQPSVDGMNTWLVSRAARTEVKVAISGLGGDELFAGYPHYAWLSGLRDPSGPRRAVGGVAALLHRMRPNRWALRAHLAGLDVPARLSQLRRILDDFDLPRALREPWQARFAERLATAQEARLPPNGDEIQVVSHWEIHGYLLSTLLRDADIASMAHGLELRPVLLHHPLVELAYALPARCKLGDGQQKRSLLAAVADLVPEPIRRRRKMGFQLPVTAWMAGPLRPRIEALWASPALRELLTDEYRTRVARALRRGRPPYALWAWSTLAAWIERHRIHA